MKGRSSRARRRTQSGAVVVEFALTVPILLVLLLGILQYGTYFYARQGGSDVARDAARRAAVGEPAVCAAFREAVTEHVDEMAGAEAPTTITRTYEPAAGSPDPTRVMVGDSVVVRIQFRSADLNLPFVPLPNGGVITSTVTSRVEYVPTAPEACP